jgi:hypothetical protein
MSGSCMCVCIAVCNMLEYHLGLDMKGVRFGGGGGVSIYHTQKVALCDKSVVSTGFREAGQLCLYLILILYSFLSLGHIVSWLLPGETEIHYPVSPFYVCRGNGICFSMYFLTIVVPFTVRWSRPASSACYHSCVPDYDG